MLRHYLLWTVSAHLVWEVAQLPLYTLWAEAPARDIAFAVLHCTGGDVLIAGASLSLALVVAGRGDWPGARFWRVAALATAIGAGYTVYSEWLNTGVRAAWTYADAMPVVPGLGTGLSPLAQWLVLPPLGLWLCRRGLWRRAPDFT
ncbi:MAG: hypothetical protein GTN79_08975 [Gammaproteobacteria bacterium]|nr:hypothetical protein [Acidobacteriota bacterium]NIP64395.1 hypothetical protein [Gammaproteobacteria bacterium]NIQ26801.1 hypothetical protein [Gammaproteobacteria bacterium]NIR19855.1 hypothetical protein [Gammaproteobacteria bacterium]NIT09977.1 hypothetical protein [Acidobacteriota bacterium]